MIASELDVAPSMRRNKRSVHPSVDLVQCQMKDEICESLCRNYSIWSKILCFWFIFLSVDHGGRRESIRAAEMHASIAE